MDWTFEGMRFEEMTLRELKEAVERRNWLALRLQSAGQEILRQEQLADQLSRQLEKEEEDLQELETGGIHSFFKTVFRDRGQVLDKERMEAAAAGAKYETAQKELARMREQERIWAEEFRRLHGCEQAFEAKYLKRKEELSQQGGGAAKKIIDGESAIGAAREQLREIEEALQAAQAVMEQVRQIQTSLSSAEGWGTWDMLGGGILATMAKRSSMSDAEDALPELQRRLNRLSAELKDVSLSLDHQIDTGGFLSFADWFFDGLFVDWMVQSQIHDFQKEIAQVQVRVEDDIIPALCRLQAEIRNDIQKTEEMIRDCVAEMESMSLNRP